MALVQQTEMQLWLDKVEAWGQARSVNVQKDTCLHLCSLRDFLQRLLMHVDGMSSTTETMKAIPSLGQILGRLCWNPVVTADGESLIFQCLWELYSEHPANALERKANQWIQKLLCQLTTEEDESPSDFLLKHLDLSPTRYHNQVLRKVLLLTDYPAFVCRCSCDRIVSTCVACVPLVTCPEVAPLLGALLQRPLTCAQATLTNDFLDAVSSAYRSGSLSLENQAVVALWCHSLPSLEEAMLGLLESTVAAYSTDVVLPAAVTLYKKKLTYYTLRYNMPRNLNIIYASLVIGRVPLIHSHFFFFVPLQNPLKAFFPHSPPNLLLPLLTQPPGQCVCVCVCVCLISQHTIPCIVQTRRSFLDGVGVVFEAWFVLVQCSHWVHEALRLLATTEARDCHPLLWLLTFYHHPTNRGHHRNQQLVMLSSPNTSLHPLFTSFLSHPSLTSCPSFLPSSISPSFLPCPLSYHSSTLCGNRA
uniref:FA complementation group C n=1 Tax=Hippocampus comes TaxID=109280 RepID=A0A3Q2YAB0_HIPCM